jgi:hypothetical protein
MAILAASIQEIDLSTPGTGGWLPGAGPSWIPAWREGKARPVYGSGLILGKLPLSEFCSTRDVVAAINRLRARHAWRGKMKNRRTAGTKHADLIF